MDTPLPFTSSYLEVSCRHLVDQYQLAIEGLTREQLASAIRQAIEAGEFQRHIAPDGRGQAVDYVPGRELRRTQALYHELLYAVASKWDGESRHQTALRYIQEAERRSECGQTPPCPAES